MDLENELISLLKKHNISYALTLPCAKIKRLLTLTHDSFHHIPLSREEEGIGIASGIHLAGKKSVMMIQSGGIGNSLNAMLSLALVYKIPIPIIISWRGIYKEKIEAQVPVGKYLPAIFKATDFPFFEIHEAKDFAKIEQALTTCFEQNLPVGIFISPQFWEASEFDSSIESTSQPDELSYPERSADFNIALTETTIQKPVLTRFQALEALQEQFKDKIIVSNIGVPSKELHHIIDQPSNFYMLGSFGLVSAIGLGLALTTDKEVLVLDGDASILTNPNILGTIVQEKQHSKNLTILLLDNGTCGSTGNQLTFAYGNIDLELLARAYGFTYTQKVYNQDDIQSAFHNLPAGPRLLHIIIKPGNASVANIPLKALEIKERFQKFLNG
ncbi:MAG: sulfopyruvate decarboxylase subunit alpha [Candidatus Heimdallarchaeota archaeon]